MKAVKTISKILVALAAIAGAVYVIATYGDKIVAWAKNLLSSCKCCGGECERGCDCDCGEECECECAGECKCCCEAEEEAPAAEEAPAEEAPVEEAGAVVADEADFEG